MVIKPQEEKKKKKNRKEKGKKKYCVLAVLCVCGFFFVMS